MADGANLFFDMKAIDAASDRLVRRYLTAGRDAVGSATKGLERRLEAAGEQAGLKKLAKAFTSKEYPKRGPARNPVGEVFLKGRDRTYGAYEFWTQPGAVRGRNGQYLAIPLPAAGSRGRLRDLTPGEWERRTGQKLRFVYRPGRASLLVADGGVFNGRTGTYRPVTRPRTAADVRRGHVRHEATVPIFVLVPLVRHRNALAIKPLVDAAEGELTKEFFAAIASLKA